MDVIGTLDGSMNMAAAAPMQGYGCSSCSAPSKKKFGASGPDYSVGCTDVRYISRDNLSDLLDKHALLRDSLARKGIRDPNTDEATKRKKKSKRAPRRAKRHTPMTKAQAKSKKFPWKMPTRRGSVELV